MVPVGSSVMLELVLVVHSYHVIAYLDDSDFMMTFSGDKQVEIIETFNSTSRYFDDLLNIDNTYADGMVNQIYTSELQLNKANSSDTEASFPDLHVTISDGFVSSKIYDKRDNFDFHIVYCPFL